MSDLHQDPSTWGPSFWRVLHVIAHAYPRYPNAVTKRKYYDLIQNVPLFLPGESHGRDFERLLNKYPVTPYLDSRDSFIKWTSFIHNRVNTALGKATLAPLEAEEAYVRRHGGLPGDPAAEQETSSALARTRTAWCCCLGLLLALAASIGV